MIERKISANRRRILEWLYCSDEDLMEFWGPANSIAYLLNMKTAHVNVMLMKMVEKGLVETKVEYDAKRTNRLYRLTAKGIEYCKANKIEPVEE